MWRRVLRQTIINIWKVPTPWSSEWKRETVSSFEMLIMIYQNTRRHILEENNQENKARSQISLLAWLTLPVWRWSLTLLRNVGELPDYIPEDSTLHRQRRESHRSKETSALRVSKITTRALISPRPCARFLLQLLCGPERGDCMFLRNVEPYPNYAQRPCSSTWEFKVSNKSVYGATALVVLGRFFSFLIYTHSVGLLGRGISLSQGRYLHTEQHKHRINAHRHPCLEWDSNSRSQFLSGRRWYMP
jgi:hypothetical protein